MGLVHEEGLSKEDSDRIQYAGVAFSSALLAALLGILAVLFFILLFLAMMSG
jgi:hypothetical protein